MKVRESGMPEEAYWNSFFDPDEVLDQLGLKLVEGDVVEFGCGYGTFTIPIARRTRGLVHAIDIDPPMLAATAAKAAAAELRNVHPLSRDMTLGTGLAPASAVYAVLFNILHAEDPQGLLAEAYRVLASGGRAAIMHWNWDPTTPRGPPLEIRPTPEQCLTWARAIGFTALTGVVDLPPFHYGLVLQR